LDATIEEVLRTSLTFAGVERGTQTDAVVLGHLIPKGTVMMVMQNGPDFRSPPIDPPEELRSPGAQAAKDKVGRWNPADMHQFRPERWLSKDEEGNDVFNPKAGPHLTFGYGRRACFGKKLAYLQLRIVVVMLIWNFELQKCPPKLSTYDAVQKATKLANKCYVRLAPAT